MGRDIGEELRQLRELRESGALSDEEYRRAKASLTGSTARDSGMSGREEIEARPSRSRVRSGEATGKDQGERGPSRDRSGARGLYRDSGKLVIREGAQFPSRCVICNRECDGEPVHFTFKREKSHYIELAVLQTVANAAADLLKGAKYTGPVLAAIPLCPWHRSRRLRRVGVGVGIMALAAAYLLGRYFVGGAGEFAVEQISMYSVVAVLVAIAGLGVALAAIYDPTKVWFKIGKFHDRFVWLDGAGRDFVSALPRIEEYR
jgi:hypothetical protein